MDIALHMTHIYHRMTRSAPRIAPRMTRSAPRVTHIALHIIIIHCIRNILHIIVISDIFNYSYSI